MYFRQFVGQGYGEFWRGVIFDRTYKNLDDLKAKAKKWFTKFGDGAKFLESKSDFKWVWPTGEELLFRHIRKDEDYWNYHGQEFPFIGWNELTKYPTPNLYKAMMSCNRSSFVPSEHGPLDKDGNRRLIPEIPLVVFSTTNPYGPGHNWVKKQFIDVAEPGVVVRVTSNVYNPRTEQKEDVTRTQVHIFGSYKENKYLSPTYVAELDAITDPNKRRAWLWGDWNITAGGALDDLWGDYLIVPRFKVPSNWYADRSMDWGTTKPFAVGWWAVANGEEVELPDGRTFCPAAGSLIRCFEWYGCDRSDPVNTNVGLKMGIREFAQGVLEREKRLIAEGWLPHCEPGPADNSIGTTDDPAEVTLKQKMEEEGLRWTSSIKSKGSRVAGLQLLRDRMLAAKNGEGPAVYLMACCRDSMATLPSLPRDEDNPDDVDTDAEDHLYDEWRYRMLAGDVRYAKKLNITFPS